MPAFMAANIHVNAHMSIQVCIGECRYDPALPFVASALTQAAPADASPDTGHAVRKAAISREDLLAAALRLIGPHRSVSSLSLREVAREAGIAPNSFYRQFRDIDELAVALIDLAGQSLRRIVGAARHRAASGRSLVHGSVEAFMEQLRADDRLLHVLLREGTVGSDAFKSAVDRELGFFEEELRIDLIRFAKADGVTLHEPALAAKAITRLAFAMGSCRAGSPRRPRCRSGRAALADGTDDPGRRARAGAALTRHAGEPGSPVFSRIAKTQNELSPSRIRPIPPSTDPSPRAPPFCGAAASMRPARRENGSDCSHTLPGPVRVARNTPSPPKNMLFRPATRCTSMLTVAW
jgi:AcrR family transcriptional regulator